MEPLTNIVAELRESIDDTREQRGDYLAALESIADELATMYPVPPDVKVSIRAILDYDEPTEHADYEREGKPEGHVYEHLRRVREWIDN